MVIINTKAILFDLDGTLVDSISIIKQIWCDWALSNRINVDDIIPFIHGTSAKNLITKFAPNLDWVGEDCRLLKIELSRLNMTSLIPGVTTMIQSLKNIKWGIVTSSPYELALAKLKIHNLPTPEVLITADDVLNGKPHPESFLLAAERLNIPAKQCLVFEDSNAGINSAYTAKMQVIQVSYAGHTKLNQRVVASIKDFNQVTFIQGSTNDIQVKIIS